MAMDKSKHHQLVEEAAHWIVQLSSDDESSRKTAKQKFEEWKKPVSNIVKWLPILNSVSVQFKNFPKPVDIKSH